MKEYGPVFTITIPPNSEAVVICDPSIAAQVRSIDGLMAPP